MDPHHLVIEQQDPAIEGVVAQLMHSGDQLILIRVQNGTVAVCAKLPKAQIGERVIRAVIVR